MTCRSFVTLSEAMPLTIGQKLRETREIRGLTLSEAAFQTHIREYYLDALEKNQFSKLPSLVQGKGFLRNYALFLNLDVASIERAWYHPDHLVQEDETALPDDQEDVHLETKSGSEEQSPLTQVSQQQSVIIHEFDDNESEQKPVEISRESVFPESQKIFTHLGQLLRQQRELLNLSLDDIERFTSIRTHYLQSLEQGDLDQLPSVVQGRGMLSNYSNFLNLDTEKLLLMFAEGLQTRRNEQYAPQRLDPKNQAKINQPNIASPGWHRFITADLLIVSTLIVSLFIFILWGAANVTRSQNNLSTATASFLSDLLLDDSNNTTPTPEVTPSVQGVLNGSQPANPVIGTEEAPPSPQQSDLPVNIYIVARQRAYLRVTRDGVVVYNGRTIPGNAYEFSGKESIELLTGNAAALDVYFNQEQLGRLGDVAEVKNLIFSAEEGIITPTAQFTFTPTQTLKVTATKQPSNTATVTPSVTIPLPTVTPFIP